MFPQSPDSHRYWQIVRIKCFVFKITAERREVQPAFASERVVAGGRVASQPGQHGHDVADKRHRPLPGLARFSTAHHDHRQD
jgi:hypothetical protein